jgi:hypothetical protein
MLLCYQMYLGTSTSPSSDQTWSDFVNICLLHYEGIKRELQRRPIYEYRYDERLKTKVEGSTCLTYTGLFGGLEHLKIETRLIDERLFIMNQ